MNEIVDKFLLAGDKFMPELHLKQLGFIKKVFFIGLTILLSFTSVNSLSSISMNNQACKVRPEIVNVNNNNPIF